VAVVIEGVDYSWGRPGAPALIRAGKHFACRYVSLTNNGKNMTSSEIKVLSLLGIKTVTNWEWDTHDVLTSRSTAADYAQRAQKMAVGAGMPGGRPIYFSCDFDIQPHQYAQAAAWFDAIKAVLPVNLIGVYGGYNIVEYLFSHKLVAWGWQTYAWSYGKWSKYAQIQQYSNGHTIGGADVDLDRAMVPDYGGWTHTSVHSAPDDPLAGIDQSTTSWDYHGIIDSAGKDMTTKASTLKSITKAINGLRQ
jgi:hypothetical protein